MESAVERERALRDANGQVLTLKGLRLADKAARTEQGHDLENAKDDSDYLRCEASGGLLTQNSDLKTTPLRGSLANTRLVVTYASLR
jgi:hypothetical protein